MIRSKQKVVLGQNFNSDVFSITTWTRRDDKSEAQKDCKIDWAEKKQASFEDFSGNIIFLFYFWKLVKFFCETMLKSLRWKLPQFETFALQITVNYILVIKDIKIWAFPGKMFWVGCSWSKGYKKIGFCAGDAGMNLNFSEM